MQKPDIKKEEIQEKLSGMSPYVRIEYLENCLKTTKSVDIKKFCHLKLSEYYELGKMYSEAAKNLNIIGEITLTFKEKIANYLKEGQLWIKAEDYDKAEKAFINAITNASKSEKEAIKRQIREIYSKQAELYEKENKRNKALKIYEKLYHNSEGEEREKLKIKLLGLYKALGKIREYSVLSGSAAGPDSGQRLVG